MARKKISLNESTKGEKREMHTASLWRNFAAEVKIIILEMEEILSEKSILKWKL